MVQRALALPSIEQMNLVFIYGAPAVGKLTVARELAKLTAYRLFHNHLTVDLLTAIFDFGSEPFVLLREEIWLVVFREAARRGVSLIFTFNPERSVTEQFIRNAMSTVEEFGGKILFVELNCSPQEIERRLQHSSRMSFGKLHSLEQYRNLKADGAFVFTALPQADLSLDTTENSPIATAKSIAEHLSLT